MGVPLVALGVRPPNISSPLDQYGKAVQLKSMMEQQKLLPGQLQQQQENLKAVQLENAQRQYQAGATQALNKSYQNAISKDDNGLPQINGDVLSKNLAESGYGSEIPGVMENINKFNKSLVDLQESHATLQGKQADLIGSAGAAIQAAKYDPKLAHTILDAFPNSPHIQQMRQTIDTNPDQFKQLVDADVAQSAKQQQMANDRKIAEIRAGNEKNQALQAWMQKPENAGKDAADYEQYLEKQKTSRAVDQAVKEATNPQIQGSKIAVAKAGAQARSDVETKAAQGDNPALAGVPKAQVVPATAAAEKANKEFADAKSVSDRMNATMDAARKGNVVSYQIIPEEGTLQITTSQGVHRINKTEIDQYGGGGSLWQRMEGHFGGALTGKSIPDSVLKDMAEIQNIQAQGSQSRYENTLSSINQTYGSKFKPVQMEGLKPSSSGGLPNGGGRIIDKATAIKFYQQAGGDPNKARQLAIENGWKVQ